MRIDTKVRMNDERMALVVPVLIYAVWYLGGRLVISFMRRREQSSRRTDYSAVTAARLPSETPPRVFLTLFAFHFVFGVSALVCARGLADIGWIVAASVLLFLSVAVYAGFVAYAFTNGKLKAADLAGQLVKDDFNLDT